MLKAAKSNFFTMAVSILMFLLVTIVASPSVFSYATDNSVQITIGSSSGAPGNDIVIPINFSNISATANLNNCDFTITYDKSKLTLVSVTPGSIVKEPVDFNYNDVLDLTMANPLPIGQVNFLFADESADNSKYITDSGVFANMTFHINSTVTTGSAININKNSVGSFSLCDASLTSRQAVFTNGIITASSAAVDKTALSSAITTATTLINSKTVGTDVGDVPQAAKTTFQGVIDAAKLVLNNTSVSQTEVTTQLGLLSAATTAFNNAIISAGVTVDKTTLNTAITNATTLINSKTVGAAVGNVPQAAKTTFQAVIDAAKLVNNDQSATQAQVDAQVNTLAIAAATFKTTVIVDTLESLNVTINNVISAPGGQVTVPILISNLPAKGLAGANLTIDYDSTKMSVVSVAPGGIITNPDANFEYNSASMPGKVKLMFIDNSGGSNVISSNGTFANITFKINTDTPVNDYLITAEAIPVGAFASPDSVYNVNSQNGKITVTSVIYGDVDGDGIVTGNDFLKVKQMILGKITSFPAANGDVAGDVDGYPGITANDALKIKQFILGKIDKFPCEQ